MPDVDRENERVAHQAAKQTDHAIGREHARGGKTVAGDGGALDVVDGLDKIVEAEGDRGDEEHTEKLKTGKHVADRRQGHAEAEVRDRISETGEREAAVVEAEEVRAPGDECAGDDGDE